jgi:hypothetical protein
MTKARDIASAAPAPSTVSATELGYLDGVTSAIQTQLDAKTAKSTLTTTGDIYYASAANTPARLAIGSTDQILKVTGGIPAWATPAASASGLTLIQRTTFSNVANTGTTFDSIFTSTYKAYQVIIEKFSAATGSDDAQIQLLYSGSALTAGYYGASGGAVYNSATFNNIQNNDAAQFTFATDLGVSTNAVMGSFLFTGVGQTTELARVTGHIWSGTEAVARVLGFNGDGQTFTGFRLKSSSTNVSGTVAVYGWATA